MGSINKQISRYEATAVFTHPDAKVDIVLVHGLNGDPQKTWTAKNGVFWPADLLPISLREARANVLVYGYNADVYSKKHGSNPSDNFIFQHAQTLVTSLTHYRKDELSSHNPIIWVCHSLGGILAKRAILYSNDLRTAQHEDYRSIYVSTYGMVFLGTPHTGSGIATWGTVLQAMSDAVVPRSFFQSESVLLKTLKRDNETLQNINSHFLDVYQRFKILMAHENHKTDLKGTRALVVDANSASPQLPGVTYYAIEATHSGMCKFESKNAPGYRTVATAIRDWVSDAPDVVATRWRVEEDEKLARAKHEIEERMKPWIQSQRLQPSVSGSITQENNENTIPSSKEPARIDNQSRPALPEPETPLEGQEGEFPSQQSKSDHDTSKEPPIFVKPTVFRPNTHFKGREKELKVLHKMLRDRQRRSVGTSSVLIQSMPGGGKTHLARQYVFQHKYDYTGGVFWIRAKTLQELEYGYWDIAKTVGLDEARDLHQGSFDDTQKIVKSVQRWLSSTEDWLLILDGILFDLPNLQNFIPFARNTSIILTSTERTPGEDYQFDNPQVIALDPLTKREAQELFFEELGKQQPWTPDDLRRAEELVELMDRLPLMIHVSALHLKATREPLAKYLRSYRTRPKVGSLPAYRSVIEQLEHRGAMAALNLMSLLSFFGTHIPVEMVILGAKALDKRTPVRSLDPTIGRVSLNNTFKTLIAFALLERNENNEANSASSQSTRSVDMGQDYLDILRVHGIVQAFFVDMLADKKEAQFWLERAVCVFCKAFDISNQRVNDDPQTGVPDDFRRFSIHGRRLMNHLDRFEKRTPELAPCREELDSRLETIQARIEQLNKRLKNASSLGSMDMIVSVFDRSNSWSEPDTESPPSNNSLIENYMLDDETEPTESPGIFSPSDHNPYHWHVTYPHGAPYTTDDDLDLSRTVTPQAPPTEVFESMSMPDDDEVTRKVFGDNHRTIRKHAERRYRDHAGAWRASSQILSDPRVSISRETVKGLINAPPIQRTGRPNSSSDSGPNTGSEAEMSLNQIHQGSVPTLQKDGTVLADISNAPVTRPKLIAGRTSYADARTEEAKRDEISVTPTFSYPPPSSKDATATIMRFKKQEGRPLAIEGLAPVKISSPLAAAPMITGTLGTPGPPSPQQSSMTRQEAVPERRSRRPSSPPSLPPSGPPTGPPSAPLSRSARSSPGQGTGPFRPPPIPVEVNTVSSLRSPPSQNSRYWDFASTNNTRIPGYPINEEADDNANDDEYSRALAHSMPSIRTHPGNNLPYPPHTVHIPPEGNAGFGGPPSNIGRHSQQHHPAPWVASPNLHPQGYSSQPMSRDPSHQSSGSHASNTSSRSHGSRQSLQPPKHHSSSPGAPASASPMLSSSSSSLPPQVMQRPRSRRPSVVETEPSPRLGALFDDVDYDPLVTSYRLYNGQTQHRNEKERERERGRRRFIRGWGSGSNVGGTQIPPPMHISTTASSTPAMQNPTGTSSGPPSPSFFSRFRGRSGSSKGRQAQQTRRDSQDRRLSSKSRPSISGSVTSGTQDPATTIPATGTGNEQGGEDMARSGSASGGFKLADGKGFVEFGAAAAASSSTTTDEKPPVDNDSTKRSTRRKYRPRNRTDGSPGDSGAASPSSPSSPTTAGFLPAGLGETVGGRRASEEGGVGLGIQQPRRSSRADM